MGLENIVMICSLVLEESQQHNSGVVVQFSYFRSPLLSVMNVQNHEAQNELSKNVSNLLFVSLDKHTA